MKKIFLSLFFLAVSFQVSALALAGSTIPPGKYSIDAAHSKVGFEIPHLVISTVEGRFNEFKGEINVSDKPEETTVTVEIQAASIDTGIEKRDNHLKNPDFFDVAKYPTLAFKGSKPEMNGQGFKLPGELTIHGVTKPVILEGKYLGSVKDQSGNDKAAFQATTRISRKDFGLTYGKVIEAGPVVGDDVTISLKIEASRVVEDNPAPK